MQQNQKTHSPKNQSPAMDTINETICEGGKMIVDVGQNLCVMFGMGITKLWEIVFNSFYSFSLSVLISANFYFYSQVFIKESYHWELLHRIDPEFFTVERLNWFLRFSLLEQHLTFIGITLFCICTMIGFKMSYLRSKFKKVFLTASLKNPFGDTPKLVYAKRLDLHRYRYDFDTNGLGVSEFKEKKERIEAQFKMNVESIKMGKNAGRVIITFNEKKMPQKVSYWEISEKKVLKPDSFYVGESSEGVVTKQISELPHLLISGTTGSGKSVFFKQCLMGLLESSKHLQLYIIDLKGGLEAAAFKALPNVKIIKSLNNAVNIMRLVKEEMDERFKFLEEREKALVIVPEREKKDRIVVAVDEASVLYMNRGQYDDDYKTALTARSFADSIAKLSRAAAIHLILATQKVDRQVIPTSVTENISGRMAFRANSLQGSIVVLGSKDAADLPEISGRGIWNVGNRQTIIQAPFIGDTEIQKRCDQMAKEFEAKERVLFGKMVDSLSEKENTESKKVITKTMNKVSKEIPDEEKK